MKSTHVAFTLSPVLHDLQVKVAHSLLSLISPLVTGKGQVGEHKVEGSKTAVEILVVLGELTIKRFTNFLPLESTRRSKNDELGHGFEEVESGRRLLGRNSDFFGEEIFAFAGNHRGIRLKGLGSKTGLDL